MNASVPESILTQYKKEVKCFILFALGNKYLNHKTHLCRACSKKLLFLLFILLFILLACIIYFFILVLIYYNMFIIIFFIYLFSHYSFILFNILFS